MTAKFYSCRANRMIGNLKALPVPLLLTLAAAAAVLLVGGCGAAGQAQAPGTQDQTGAPSTAGGRGTQTLTVSAAISLQDVFTELGKDYEARHPGVKVDFNFAASGDLEQQIVAGAPVDIFASASTKETDELAAQGRIVPDTLIKPAANDVVLVAPAAGGAGTAAFTDLTQDRFRKVAIGDPATVPAGRYAQAVLQYYQLWDGLRGRLIYGNSVRQVLDYVARGEVDAGIVYATDAKARSSEVKVLAAAPDASHKPVIYPMAVVAGSGDEAGARDFLRFVVSAPNRQVFAKYGFRPLGDG